MDTHTRMAIAAVVRGLRESGSIDDTAVHTIAAHLRAAAHEMEGLGREDHAQLHQLAADIRDSDVSGPLR
jgi:hypothetical protein